MDPDNKLVYCTMRPHLLGHQSNTAMVKKWHLVLQLQSVFSSWPFDVAKPARIQFMIQFAKSSHKLGRVDVQ